MKPASVLILSLLVAPASFSAQSSAPASNYTVTLPGICPLNLRAQHLSDGDLVKTGIAHPKGIGQALHLTLSDLDRGPVAEANVLLRGFTPKGRLSQAAPDAKPNATRRQRIRFAPGQNQSADIWVPGLSAITSVEIVSVTYANGSSWTPSGSLSCRVTPDLFMPIHP